MRYWNIARGVLFVCKRFNVIQRITVIIGICFLRMKFGPKIGNIVMERKWGWEQLLAWY